MTFVNKTARQQSVNDARVSCYLGFCHSSFIALVRSYSGRFWTVKYFCFALQVLLVCCKYDFTAYLILLYRLADETCIEVGRRGTEQEFCCWSATVHPRRTRSFVRSQVSLSVLGAPTKTTTLGIKEWDAVKAEHLPRHIDPMSAIHLGYLGNSF